MHRSIFKIAVVLSILIVLVGISGSLFVRAQEQNEPGGETGRPASSLPPKVPGQDVPGIGNSAVAAGDEVVRPASDLGDKALILDQSTGDVPAEVLAAPGGDVSVQGAPGGLAHDPRSAASLIWFTNAGAVFLPYSNVVTWNYGGSGCIAPSTTGYWRSSVNIPDGSIMKQIYFGFYNSAASTVSTAFLYRYNYMGSYAAVAQVNSVPGSTVTGYSFTSTIFTNETVNNYTNSYVFAWSGSTTQQLCYIQVGYTPPSIFGVALPSVMKQP